MKIRLLTLLAVWFSVAVCRADDEAYPTIHVAANGPWYAKCVPVDVPNHADRINPDDLQWKGKTFVYMAKADRDELLYTFDWFSPKIYISRHGDIVRIGKWPEGTKASAKALAISFYSSGKLAAAYSTLDLAGSERNVQASVSHHTVIQEIVGFVRIFKKVGRDTLTNDPGYGFEIVLHDGQRLVFDPSTGKQIEISQDMFTKRY